MHIIAEGIMIMSIGKFTQKLEDNFWNTPNPDDDNFSTVIDYLNQAKNFRMFSSGLTTLISQCGYDGDQTDINKKTKFLLDKFSAINYRITRSTIVSWFNDSHRPDPVEESRDKMFALCFALQCSLKQVYWLFRNVYFDRQLNCRNKNEVVYYYCFKNNYDYMYSMNLIKK